jgi:hypothetical protein
MFKIPNFQRKFLIHMEGFFRRKAGNSTDVEKSLQIEPYLKKQTQFGLGPNWLKLFYDK